MPLWLPDYHVPPCEESWEYNPSWGGPAPVLWLHAGHQANVGDTTAFDLSPYRNNGTLVSGPSPAVTSHGRAWCGFAGNASYDYIGLDDSIAFGTGAWTIVAWADCEAYAWGGLWGKDGTGNFRHMDNGENCYVYNDSNGYQDLGAMGLSGWHHYAFSFDGTTVRGYRDGAIVDSGPFSTGGNCTLWRVGSSGIGGDAINGDLQSFAAFPACLTPQQIHNLYTSTLDGSPGIMARPIGRRVFKATAVTPTATVAGRLPQRRVEPHEESFEYNPSWGGPAPVLWLHAGHGANKGDTTAFDLSPYRNNGTWSGSTTGRSIVTERGRVWTCPHISDELRAPNSATAGLSEAVSIALWFCGNVPSGSIAGVGSWNGSTGFILGPDDGDRAGWYVPSGSSAYNSLLVSSLSLNDGAWHFLVGTFKAGAYQRLYLDGAQIGEDTTSIPAAIYDNGGGLDIGNRGDGSKPLDGEIESVAVYPDALTPQQIWQLYTSTLDGSPGIMARPIGRRVFKATAVTPTATVAGRLPQRRVEPYEAEFEYNEDWGGPAPVLWLHAGHGSNKGDATAFDLSPQKRRLSWSGSTSNRNVVTQWGRAFSGDGSTDYLTLDKSLIIPAGSDLTIAAWVSPDAVGGTIQSLYGHAPSGTNDETRSFFYQDEWRIYDENENTSTIDSVGLSAGVRQYMVLRYDHSATDCVVYRNGAQVSQETDGLSVESEITVLFAYEAGSSNGNWGGLVWDLAIWPDALTPQQIHNLYTSTLDGSPGIMARPIGRRVFAVGGAAPSGYTLTCDYGSLSLTGQSTSLLAARKLAAAQASYTVSGQAAGVLANRKLPASVGSVTLSGQDANLLLRKLLSAALGSFAVTGQDTALKCARKLSAGQGSFTLTGQAASLKFARKLAAAVGSFTATGQDASLLVAHKLGASVGSFVLNGQNIAFVYGETLQADTGSFTLSGQDANLIVSRKLSADSGSYTLSGQVANLLRHRLLAMGVGSLTLTGQDAALLLRKVISAATGSYALTGQDAALKVSLKWNAESGTFTITGQDAGLFLTRVILAAAGSYSLSGQDAGLKTARKLGASGGTFTLTGQPLTMNYSGAGGGGSVFSSGVFRSRVFGYL